MRNFYAIAIVEKNGDTMIAKGKMFAAETPVCARHQMENYCNANKINFFEVLVSAQSIKIKGVKNETQTVRGL